MLVASMASEVICIQMERFDREEKTNEDAFKNSENL